MRTYLMLVAMVLPMSCGNKKDDDRVPAVQPEVRRLSLSEKPDGEVDDVSELPECSKKCMLWLIRPAELRFCLAPGYQWEKLSDYVDDGQTMYCHKD